MKKIIILVILLQNLFAVDAKLDIIRKNTMIPKVVVNSVSAHKNYNLVKKIVKVLRKDLEVSGHFNVKKSRYQLVRNNSRFNYISNDLTNIDLFISLDIIRKDKLEIKLFDLNKQSIVFTKEYNIINVKRFPFLTHDIAVDVNNYFKAPPIDWMKKLVIFSKYTTSKQSDIIIADYTLTYQRVVVRGGLNIFPKWANRNQTSFYYTTYNWYLPTLMKQNLYSSKKMKILTSQGVMFCSDVSFKSNKIVVTMAPYGQPDIYIYDTKRKIKIKVTHYSGIDVGGSFINNEKKIVFISDRLGKPNIFAKSIYGKRIERLVYHGKNNSQVTSYKNYIVYSSREGRDRFSYNNFNLYLISTQNDSIRKLTINGINKSPKFSTDGESLLFIKQDNGRSYIGIMRLKYNKSFLFNVWAGKIQSIDW